jgi:hypothetical protein
MKTTLFLNGKKTTQKAMRELIGEARLERCIDSAKQAFREDPLEQNDFMVPGGMLMICFE